MALNEDFAEAQRLVGDQQPEDSRVERVSIGRKMAFHNLHVAVALGSIAFVLYDVTIDYYMAYEFYAADQRWYAALSVTFFVVPALLASCLSGFWYLGGEQRRQCFPAPTKTAWTFRIACHAFLLSPLARLVDSLRCGLKCKSALKEKNVDKFRKYDALLVYEDRDATFLRLLAAYLGTAPQVLVRLTAMAQGAFGADRHDEITPALWQHAVVAVGSVSSLAWATVAFKVTSDLARQQQDNRQRSTDWPRKLIYGLGHFFAACARLVALAVGAAFLPNVFWTVVALHLTAAFAYVWWYHRKETPANPFSWDKDSIKDHAAYVFLAVVHTFTFLNLNHHRTSARYLIYFTLCFLENTVLMTCWWFLQGELDGHDLEHYLLFWMQMAAFVLGLILLWCSHRSRVVRHKAIPHESHVNGFTNEETPLKQDKEVCQEVAVVADAFEKQELDLQENAPSVVVHDTSIETVEPLDNEQSSDHNEEPVKEKVIEIWFSGAPKSAVETKTDNSAKSGQRETEDGHSLTCAAEPVAKKETAASAVPQLTRVKRNSEIRPDDLTADTPAAVESIAIKVEQAVQESAGRQYEDVEKLLLELNAYNEPTEEPQVPRQESGAPTQQIEKSESQLSVAADARQHAAPVSKRVAERPQQKTKEESNFTGEPIDRAEERVASETRNKVGAENVDADRSKRAEDGTLATPLPPKVESVAMRSEECRPAESERQLREAGNMDEEPKGVCAPGEIIEPVEQNAADQLEREVDPANEELDKNLSPDVVQYDGVETQLPAPIETDRGTQPDVEELSERRTEENYENGAKNDDATIESNPGQGETAEQNFPGSEKPQNDGNGALESIQESVAETQEPVRASEPMLQPIDANQASSLGAAVVVDVSEDVNPSGTDAPTLITEKLASQEQDHQEVIQSGTRLEREKDACETGDGVETASEAVHEGGANQVQSEPQLLEDQVLMDQHEILEELPLSKTVDCDLQPVETAPPHEAEDVPPPLIVGVESLVTPQDYLVLEQDEQSVEVERVEQVEQCATPEINQYGLASETPQLTDEKEDQMNDEKPTSNGDLPINELQHKTTQVPVGNEGRQTVSAQAGYKEATPAVDASDCQESDVVHENPFGIAHPQPDAVENSLIEEQPCSFSTASALVPLMDEIEQPGLANGTGLASTANVGHELSAKLPENDVSGTFESATETPVDLPNDVQKETLEETICDLPALENSSVDKLEEEPLVKATEDIISPQEEPLDNVASQEEQSNEKQNMNCDDSGVCDSTVEPQVVSQVQDSSVPPASTETDLIGEQTEGAVSSELEENSQDERELADMAEVTTTAGQGQYAERNPVNQTSAPEDCTSVPQSVEAVKDEKDSARVKTMEHTVQEPMTGNVPAISENTFKAASVPEAGATTEDKNVEFGSERVEDTTQVVSANDLNKIATSEMADNASLGDSGNEDKVEEGAVRSAPEKSSPSMNREEKRPKFQSRIPRKKP